MCRSTGDIGDGERRVDARLFRAETGILVEGDGDLIRAE
jgi:hypothetical protein